MMSPAEQAALVFLLEHLRPKVAIEIGTRFGGSLEVLEQFCERVYSLDVDPGAPASRREIFERRVPDRAVGSDAPSPDRPAATGKGRVELRLGRRGPLDRGSEEGH